MALLFWSLLACEESVPLPEAYEKPPVGRMVRYGTLSGFLVTSEQPWSTRLIWTSKTLSEAQRGCAIQSHPKNAISLLVEPGMKDEAREYISELSQGPFIEKELDCRP
jgi:hypothetical protein